jgi:polyphenol oxidase
MRALDASDPNDPRGFVQQAHIHCFNCGQGVQVHGSWQFFAWHRAYLYFHERILGKLIGNANFRLPYWDWDSPSHRRMPTAYTTPSGSGNSLDNSTRVLGVTTPVPNEDVDSTVMNPIYLLSTFTDFGGSASFSGVPEGTPHGAVHVDVGGNMGAFATAAHDPLFYAHHSNVDRVWSLWNKAASTHTNPTDPAFLDLTFTFYDENKVWRSIKASDVLDHERSLRYVYEPYSFWDRFLCLIWRPIVVDWISAQGILIAPEQKRALGRVASAREPVVIRIEGLQLPRDHSAVYRIYAGADEARRDGGPGSPGYLGNTALVINDADNKHPAQNIKRAVFEITRELPHLLQSQTRIPLYLVERGSKDPSRRLIPVTARSVTLERGEADMTR